MLWWDEDVRMHDCCSSTSEQEYYTEAIICALAIFSKNYVMQNLHPVYSCSCKDLRRVPYEAVGL